MIKRILLAGLVLIVGILAFAATKPDTLHVERSGSINTAPDKIFPLIDDFRNWRSWSPYENKDPDMKRIYSGAGHGKGAIYEWDGDANVGQGRMEILESQPPSKVTIKLDFITPFEGHNVAEFRVDGQGSTTAVTWAMSGPSDYMGKLISVFMDLDRMIGSDFETGLANLKRVAEQ